MDYIHVASRKFCCCLPVRLGVFVLSGFSAVLSALSAYSIWFTVADTVHKGIAENGNSTINWTPEQFQNATLSEYQHQLETISLDKQQFYAFIIIGIIVSIYCLFSVFGFIGAVFARRALVAFYSTALWFLLLVNLAIGAYSSWAAVNRRQTVVNECVTQTANTGNSTLANDENKLTSDVCGAASRVGVILTILVFVVQWLIQLYACIIVKRYVEQLSEQQGYRRQMAGNRISKGGEVGGYYAHQPLGHHEMMPPPSGPYPYSQHDHSYGNKV